MRHSELGPSKAHRYRLCAGSILAERGLPDDSGIEAAIGQCFHEYAELCLITGFDPQVFVGREFQHEKFGLLTFTQEMADHMLYGLDFVRDVAAEEGTRLFVETEVDLSPWLGEGQIGTSDVGIIDVKRRRITIFDWKYGMIPVAPLWNDQGILYCLGFWHTVAAELFGGDPSDIDVTIVIEQPRTQAGGGVWHTTMEAILKEGAAVKRDAEATRDPQAPRVPGPKQCQFCKAAKAKTCPEYLSWQLQAFDLNLEEIDELAEIDAAPPLPSLITPERRAYLVLHAGTFKAFFDRLHAESYRAAENGQPDPGMKLVAGRSPPRKWKDEEKEAKILERRLGENAYSKKLRSPSQVEELIGKRVFKETYNGHVLEQTAKPILVPVTDQRDAVQNRVDRFSTLLDIDDLI